MQLMQLVLSRHWRTALKHGKKFINAEQCVDGKLGDIMKDYDKYKIKKPTLKESPLELILFKRS